MPLCEGKSGMLFGFSIVVPKIDMFRPPISQITTDEIGSQLLLAFTSSNVLHGRASTAFSGCLGVSKAFQVAIQKTRLDRHEMRTRIRKKYYFANLVIPHQSPLV